MSAESAAPVVDGSFSAAAIIQPYIRPAPVIRPIARMARKRGVFARTRDRQWRMSQAAPKPVIKAQSKPATAPAAVPRSADPRNILPWNTRMIMRIGTTTKYGLTRSRLVARISIGGLLRWGYPGILAAGGAAFMIGGKAV